ncbi:HIT domain-containing protein [Brevundimonas diminuta]|uniref:HIT domain-containing protein n=1 Tax=Brevundimonas diminuta TaxID=293 RepID=UPI003D001A0D
MPSPSDLHAEFRADPAFEAASVFAAEWSLCQVRLQDDARFPWLILLPRVAGAVELEDLSFDQRALLTEEIVRAGALVRVLGALRDQPVDKLNVAALGNVTAQLHIHVVGRRRDDPLWPDPVWGRPGAVPCAATAREKALSHIAAF